MGISETLKKFVRSNDQIGSIVIPLYMKTLYPSAVRKKAKKHGLTTKFNPNSVEIADKSRAIIINRNHAVYIGDMIENFQYFHGAVKPVNTAGVDVVDYTKPKFHDVIGYDLHPIFFASIAETFSTTHQYIEFAGLREGSVVIDLGAYSGLSSIIFRQECGDSGRVVSVEADGQNINAIRQNFALYKEATGRNIDLVEGAVWIHSNGISFSSEGSAGSSATDIVGNRMGAAKLVRSFTLNDIAKLHNLEKVDFIKCDIEGAEEVIFGDAEFFSRFRPKIIVEIHPVNGVLTTEAVRQALAPYGYECKLIEQDDYYLPLLECAPQA
jgi:FkbM family methyltransferase